MTMPDVSIILITYNDAERLPRAIASLQQQSLHNVEIIIVDDASTDDTPKVVASHVEQDDRIVSIRLERNSGGCSAPRNAGLECASGTWVMFCDSDDVMERHAAKNLLLAVEAADADLGCGIAERVVGERRKRWREEAHEPGVITDIEQRPRLIYDTICVNKIYRRSWLVEHALRFLDGVLYEDQLFTMQCFLHAERIAIIDRTVYFWTVEHLSEDPSITQQRHELRNVASRIEVNERIDALLTDRPLLRGAKDVKFLSHDLYLYLVSIMAMSDEEARRITEPLVSYVNTLDLASAAQLRPALRVAIYHLMLGDLDGVRRAMRAIKWSSSLDVRVVERDGRSMWACEHLDAGPAVEGFAPDWWLDISPLHPFAADFGQRRYCHRVTAFDIRERDCEISGRTVDAYGDLPADVRLTLQWQTRSGVAVARVVPTVHLSNGVLQWSWTGSLPNLPQATGSLTLAMTTPQGVNVMPVRTWSAPKPFQMGEFGTVTWHGAARPARWRKVAALVLGRLMPRSGTLIFGGEGPIELSSAAALAALIDGERPILWVQHLGSPTAPEGIPVVSAGSFTHLLHVARRASVVTDGGSAPFGRWVRGPRIAAVDLPQGIVGSAERHPKRSRAERAMAATWSALCAPVSSAMADWQQRMDWRGTQVPLHPVFEAARRAPSNAERPFILMAFRAEPPKMWGDVAAAISARTQIVVVRHDRRSVHIPAHLRTWVREGRANALHELIAGCSVFITDGSPATWVADGLGKPIVTIDTPLPVGIDARGVDGVLAAIDVHEPSDAAWSRLGLGEPVDDCSTLLKAALP